MKWWMIIYPVGLIYIDNILNQQKSIEELVNKSSEDNSRLTSSQSITMMQKIQYLRMAYLNAINSDLNNIVSFKSCCDQAIKQMGEVGVKYIKNRNTITQWNQIFRENEIFPHLNISLLTARAATRRPIRTLFLDYFWNVANKMILRTKH